VNTEPIAPRPLREVANWDAEADVVIVGHGMAGGAAAIEAARAGADVLVLERMSRGGGATALSTGLTYFGGGTRIQRACGFEDSVENMQRYVAAAAGLGADPERVRLYCENSVEHFEWFCALGVEFKESYYPDKVTHPLTDDSLVYTGNEEAYPFADLAEPVPRGHKAAREGESGGYMMEAILAATAESGARVEPDCRVEALVADDSGRIVGVVARREGQAFRVKARRGVILTAGGFIMNRDMVEQHMPEFLPCNYKVATAGDDGAGIRMGIGAGGVAVNMNEGLVLNAYYPPSSHLKGVLVDTHGQRFINEDAYIGRTGDAILYRAGGRAYLVVDDAIYGPTQSMHKLAAVEESFDDLEAALAMPPGALVETLEAYNRHAERGEDPAFHKARKWCRPLSEPPFAALDCTTQNSIFGVFTLGGLDVTPTGEVLSADGDPIPGLYAAGRTTAGLCREGRTYASGLSIGDASYFGRLAGVRVANASGWE
jgi:succinate dehydrogenase/fumarate reductase flavoprotein subunit